MRYSAKHNTNLHTKRLNNAQDHLIYCKYKGERGRYANLWNMAERVVHFNEEAGDKNICAITVDHHLTIDDHRSYVGG